MVFIDPLLVNLKKNLFSPHLFLISSTSLPKIKGLTSNLSCYIFFGNGITFKNKKNTDYIKSECQTLIYDKNIFHFSFYIFNFKWWSRQDSNL